MTQDVKKSAQKYDARLISTLNVHYLQIFCFRNDYVENTDATSAAASK